MATVIDNYLRLSVTACKKLGYFTPKAKATGVVTWTQGNEVVASVGFETNLTGAVPYAVLTYRYKGEPVRTELTLRFRPSNLKEGTGYYYFVCPVTGLSCRNLYLVEGKFVGRVAFRPLYRTQAERIGTRNGSLAFLRALGQYEDMLNAPYRRLTYRGKPTPYGRKVERLGKRYEDTCSRVLHTAETEGWAHV
jgi:hypothetical protein